MKKSLISEKLKSGLEFPINLYDKQKNLIYWESNKGSWWKWEYDERGNQIYEENSYGDCRKTEYDENGNLIYCKNSNGIIFNNIPKWFKKLSIQNPYNRIKKIKEVTMEELEKHFNCKVKVIK